MNLRAISLRTSFIGLSLLVAACGAGGPEPQAGPEAPPAPAVDAPEPSGPEEDLAAKHIETLAAAYADYNAEKSIEKYWADDCVAAAFDDEGATAKGPAAISKMLVEMQRAKFPDMKAVPGRIIVLDENTLLVEAVYNGTHKGDLPDGTKADGKKIGGTAAHLYTFGDDGKVKELKLMANQLRSFVQLGMVPPMAPDGKLPRVTELPSGEPTIVRGEGDAKNVEVLQKLNEASHLAKDMDAWSALLAKEVAVGFPADPDYAGVEKQRKLNEPFVKAFTKESLDFVATYAVADYAVVVVKNTATHSGKVGPFPVTNKQFTRHYIDVARIEGGKIAEIASYHNPITAMKQLGLFPPKSAAPKGAPAKKK